MSGERWVVLGLAHARSEWFRELSRQATTGALPIEFIRCVSSDEVAARLASGRSFSALVADASVPGVDRDLLDRARAASVAPIIVDDGRVERDWHTLGALAVLDAAFSPADLLDSLAARAQPVRRGEAMAGTTTAEPAGDGTGPGRLIAVTGPGGTGASTMAVALAQGAASELGAGRVLLADLALHAEQAVIHHAPDLVPGLPELVEAHRTGTLSAGEVQSLVYDIAERGYHLLLGLRRHRDWAALRPRALDAAMMSLAATYELVVADADCDLEGHEACGSVEVEERNLLARTAVLAADRVVIVGAASLKGIHSLARLTRDTIDAGVAPSRLVPVVNHAPRSPQGRAEVGRALAELVRPAVGRAGDVRAPVFVPDRPKIEHSLRDGTRLPAPLARSLAAAVVTTSGRASAGTPAPRRPELIQPGTLGFWPSPEVTQ